MFEYLKKYSKIIVTGPQRSGTTICSAMIAYDTDYTLIKEESYYKFNYIKFKFILKRFKRILDKENNFVIQAPTMCRFLEEFDSKDIVIIMMIRGIEDIIASQKRVNWKREQCELEKYNKIIGPISKVKYEYWNRIQKKKIKNYFEINYDSLSVHYLWISKELRINFGARQINL